MEQSMSVTVGVDTHSDAHVGVALDRLGRRLGEVAVPNDESGYRSLLRWARGFGEPACFGIEGTGSYGAGLSRFLRSRNLRVVEVNRTSRQHRWKHGKHDAGDAEAAARVVLSGEASGEPKAADGRVEMLRALKIARRSAVKAKTQVANQLHALVSTAPEPLKACLCRLTAAKLAEKVSRFRCGSELADPTAGTKFALRSVARRYVALAEEIADLDEQIARLVKQASPSLVELDGVGSDTAATLLIVAGDNPERLRNEGAFAHLCGTAPIPASSGKVVRHRLNPNGNREANRALYVVTLNRMRRDPRTQAYVVRRTAEGKSKKEVMRCLKRYIAREIYQVLVTQPIQDPSRAACPGPARAFRSKTKAGLSAR